MKRRRWLVGGLVLLLAAAGATAALARGGAVPVRTEVIQERPVARVVLASGHLGAAEERVVAARYPMVVAKVLVREGDAVEEGQALVEGDRRELEVERRALAAEVAAARARLAEAQAALPFQLEQAEARAAAARDEVERAREEADTAARLFEAGVIPRTDLSRARARLAAAEAQLELAEAALGEARVRAEAVGGQGREVEALEARLALVRQKLEACTVAAPCAGRVAEVRVKEGEAVTAGFPLVVLHSGDLVVEVEVLARDAPEVEVGQRAVVRLQEVKSREVAGMVTRVHPVAVERLSELGVRQRRVPVEIALEEPPGRVGPGYPVEVEIVTAEVRAVAVPRDALFRTDDGDAVFVVREGRAVLTPVTLGLEGEDYVECTGGLRAGEVVVLDPPAELRDGSRVAPSAGE